MNCASFTLAMLVIASAIALIVPWASTVSSPMG
jgi:hypothetical protein